MPKHSNARASFRSDPIGSRASARSSFLAHAGSNPAPRAAGSAHAGSNPAPRAAGSAHVGSNPAPRALNTTAEEAPRHRPRGRSGGARAHRRRASASKGKKAAEPGIYGPKDFSAWGWTQDPRFRRPEAWQNGSVDLAIARGLTPFRGLVKQTRLYTSRSDTSSRSRQTDSLPARTSGERRAKYEL